MACAHACRLLHDAVPAAPEPDVASPFDFDADAVGGFDFGAVPVPTWGLLVFYAMAASVWTVWLWMTGLQGVPASEAGVFTVMLPVSAALVGVLFLGERMNGLQLAALGLALAGVLLATLPQRRA